MKSNILNWVLLAGILCAGAASAAAVQYTYDDMGRLIRAVYGVDRAIAYAYDANGHLVHRIVQDGIKVHMLIYSAGTGGTIDGAATQAVAAGESGVPVSAVSNQYFTFVQWSDGATEATRTDIDVQTNLYIIAHFAAILAAQGTPYHWIDGHNLTDGGELTFDQAEQRIGGAHGFTAREEYIADTNPTNPASFFRIVAISNGPPFGILFTPGSTGRVYTLLYRDGLTDGAWTNVPGAGPRLGSGDQDLMQDTNSPPRGPYYRLQVEMP